VPAPDDDIDRVNWSIRLVGDEVTQWDELLYRLRRETRRRTLTKADIMRALVELAANDEATRQALIDAL
jgi:chlorite dismutase